MQFRQKALSKLQSPEEIDLPVRFARPQGWLVLSVTVIAMVAATFWAVYGSISSTVRAPGILTHAQGSYVLQSPVAGQVTEVLAEEGKSLPAGAPLLRVSTAGEQSESGGEPTAGDGSGGTGPGSGTGDASGNGAGGDGAEKQEGTLVRTLAAGRVTSLVATIGAVVTTGADVAVLERVGNARSPLKAMLYLPADNGTAVPVGARVDLTVQSVPSQQYGVLRGRVEAVGRTSQSRQQIAGFLGDGQLAEQFSRQGRPVAVLVELDRSSRTESGYAWSSSDGPPYAVESMTPAGGTIRLADQRPIDWLLP
ncbi:HlyD family efflux transporter periplasmic adaptor subunit [Streptomyces sp. WMMC940]|uniref:HlyD family efflux transporter periplasmic adaptor subunit n=1 Tax=Streptomyces sp. WMMC940 TaxID=3015153 RepID=UPI0022B65E23|nr:HlyD family efflux transporter periplasmic adaptor subunit [Streptomyces sp. WMMC940]MCZ7456875.1 HlyD family efflux transporter periplasmic adaptor subunit [Streptomyces sp. WMMC940]